MENEKRQDLKDELRTLVEGYIKDCLIDLDRKTIKDVQDCLQATAQGLDDDIDDIKHSTLGLRTKLIAWLMSEFAEAEAAVFSINADESPLGFTIEVDIPWDDEIVADLESKVERSKDGKLSKAFYMYKVAINTHNSTITFTPTSS